MKKYLIIIIIIATALAATFFIFNRPNNKTTKKEKIKIGVTYITSIQAIEDIKKGIIKGFKAAGFESGKNVVFDFQNAQGETGLNSAIAKKFANSTYNLFIPITTPSTQALANSIKNKPIIFSAVSDPISAGLVKSEKNPGGNITGAKDVALFKDSLTLIKDILPDTKTVGIIYNTGETNSKFGIDITKKYANEMRLDIITAPANNTNEIVNAANSIADKIDVFLMTNDNTVLSGQESLIKVAADAKKPVFAYEQTGVEQGALAAVGTNYEILGERTANLAVKVIKGEKPGNISIIGVSDSNIFLNKTTAQKLGIIFPKNLILKAKIIYK